MSDRYVGPREAARLLGVSEASIRRWTDSGLLPAHRVGPRQERRLLLADVMRLKSGGRAAGPRPASRVALEGVSFPLHTHLTSLYTTDAGRLRLGLPFLRDGITAGQSSILYMSDGIAELVEDELRADGVDVRRAIASGQLQRLAQGRTPDEGIASFERAFSATIRRGSVAIRVLGEAVENRQSMGTWADHLAFEDRLTALVRRYPVVILCQYDARRLDGVELVAVLKAHGDNFEQPLGMFLN